MSPQGLMPSCWGQALWHSIHSIAMAYEPNPKSRQDYFNFFASLGNVLPCEECKKHYQENFKNTQNSLKAALNQTALAPNGLFRWTYDLHNIVNEQTKVPRSKWPTYEQVVKKYEGFRVSCGTTPGVCGAVEGKTPEKRIRIVEEFGTLADLNPESIALIVVCICFAGAIGYILWTSKFKGKKRRRS